MVTGIQERNYLLHQELFEKNALLHKFMYCCSHDLKGPLSSIRGLTHLVERSPENTGEYLQLINESLSRMDQCLKSLEALMNNSWEPVANSEVDFLDIITNTLNRHLDDLKKHKIKISTRVMQEKKIFSDAARIQLVLDQLVENAIIFQRTSSVRKLIDIEVKVLVDHVRMEICDNGEGIARNSISDIFDIFYRSSEASRGSGLGLYLVKEILAKLDGEISVISSKGVGSNFIVKIPVT